MSHGHAKSKGKSGASGGEAAGPAPAAAAHQHGAAQGPHFAAGPMVGLQRKPVIGQPGDRYEQEAEDVSQRVTSGMDAPAISSITPGSLGAQTASKDGKDEKSKPVQKAAAEPAKKPEEKPVQKAAVPAEEMLKGGPPEKPRTVGPERDREKAAIQKAEAPEKKPQDKPVQKAAEPAKKPEEKPVQKADQKKPEAKPVQKAEKENEKAKPVQKAEAPKEEKKPVQKAEPKKTDDKPVQKAGDETDEEPVQADAAGGPAASAPAMAAAAEQAIASPGGGEPLNAGTRSVLEDRMGADLSGVRVHSDSAAQQSAADLNARAFTHGSDIWLARGESQNDLGLMAHEATHVVQQSGAVQRQMVQKAAPKGKKTQTGPPATAEKYTVDEANKVIRFDDLRLPPFKADHPRIKGQVLRRTAGKESRQASEDPNAQQKEWKSRMAKEGRKPAIDFLEKKIKQHYKVPSVDPSKTYVLKAELGVLTRYMIGTIDTLVEELTVPTWDRRGLARKFNIDHIKELQFDGEEGIENLWLLRDVINRESGFYILHRIQEKLRAVKADHGDKYGRTQKDILNSFTLEFKEAVPGKDFRYPLEPAGKWERDEIAAGAHLALSNIDQLVHFADLSELGGEDKSSIFPMQAGWVPKPFSNKPRVYADEKTWLKPYTINAKKFATTPTDTNSASFGSFMVELKDPAYVPQPEAPELLGRHPGSQFAGYLDKASIKQRTKQWKLPKLSPIRIDEFDIVPEEGIVMRGQVIPTIPLIRDVGLDFELRNGELSVSKTFSTGDFNLPGPLKATDCSLELSLGNKRGLALKGNLDFEIQRLGKGKLEGLASSSGDFGLKGSFDFDSKLFNPARVQLKYEKEKLSGSGELGIKSGKIKGVKSAHIEVAVDGDSWAAKGTVEPDMKGIQKASLDVRYNPETGIEAAGNLQLASDIPLVKGGSVDASMKPRAGGDDYVVKAHGNATIGFHGLTANIDVDYDDGAFTVHGTVPFEKGMLKGSITLGVTNRAVGDDGQPSGPPTETMTPFGAGLASIKIAPWLQATAGIMLLPNGELQVSGEVALPSALDVFPEKKLNKRIFDIGIDIPLVGVSVLGKRIGIFATVGGGLEAKAGIGPGQLRELSLKVDYNPSHEEETKVTGHAQFHVPASAGLRLYIKGGVGAGIPVVSAEAGLEVGATLGIEGAAQADVTVEWSPGKGLSLDAEAQVYAEPKFTFDVAAYLKVIADLWLKTITFYDDKWELAKFEYGSGLRFGISFPIHYREGQAFDVSLSDVQFQVPEIDPLDMVTGLVKRII